jgi:hypothetical protein
MMEDVDKEAWEEYTAILYELRRLGELMNEDTLREAKTLLIKASHDLDELLGQQLDKEFADD